MKSTLLVFASLMVCLGLVLSGCNQQEGKTLTVLLTTQQDPLIVPVGTAVTIDSLFTYTGYDPTNTNTKSLYYTYSVVGAPPGAIVTISPTAVGTVDASATPAVSPTATFTFNQAGTYIMRLTMGQQNGFISASNDHTFLATASN